MKSELAAGVVGTALGIVGTATQTNEILETVSLIITIVGAVISFIIVPLLNWYTRAKKDGKITRSEIEEGAEILKDGIDKTKEAADKQTRGNKNDGQKEN